jgi:hypothetical protein
MLSFRVRLFQLILLASAIAAESLPAQESRTIPDEPYCDCRIVFEHVVTLGTLDGPGSLPGEIRRVARDRDGIYYVVPWREPLIHRFAPDGTPLGSFGREGDGPGEFRSISDISFRGDSLLVWDRGNVRLTVFDGSLDLVRTMTFPGRFEAAEALAGGGYVVNGLLAGGSDDWAPLHLLDADGEHARSFGDPVTDRGMYPRRWMRTLASHGDSVWSVDMTEYRLRHWDADGTRLLELVRIAPWLTPYGDGSWSPDRPIPPRVMDLIVDPGGNLRVIVLRASPRWKELLPPPHAGPVGPVYPVPPGTGLQEAVVEILDPRGGRLIAQGVFDSDLYGLLDAETAFGYREDELGVPTVEIWRFSVRGR